MARIKAKGKSLSDALAVKVPSLERARFKGYLIPNRIFILVLQKIGTQTVHKKMTSACISIIPAWQYTNPVKVQLSVLTTMEIRFEF